MRSSTREKRGGGGGGGGEGGEGRGGKESNGKFEERTRGRVFHGDILRNILPWLVDVE